MSLFTALLIDDESPARTRLRRLLSEHSSVITILDEAADGEDARIKTESLKPDVIFLDIQIPGMNGFELLEKLKHIPVVIFTTAYDQYALKAFETNSVDYLLKPVEPARLQQAVSKLERLKSGNNREQLKKIIDLANQLTPKKEITSFPVKTGNIIHLVRVSKVAYLEAKDKYVTIHTIDGEESLSDVSLKVMEEKLPDNFLRIHRSYIVNKSIISEIQKYFQGKFVICLNDKNRTRITSGSAFSNSIKDSLEQL